MYNVIINMTATRQLAIILAFVSRREKKLSKWQQFEKNIPIPFQTFISMFFSIALIDLFVDLNQGNIK